MPRYKKLPESVFLKFHSPISLKPGWYKTGNPREAPSEEDQVLHIENGEANWYKGSNTVDLHRVDGPAHENDNGRREWLFNGKEHRIDGPAVEWGDDYREWWVDGELHREDGPAIEYSDGAKDWYIHGEQIRVSSQEQFKEMLDRYHHGGSPVLLTNGDQIWYKNGVIHREDGPAVITDGGGYHWMQNGEYHRESGPAIEDDETKSWYIHGKLHREDGPAVVDSDGNEEWWVRGEQISISTLEELHGVLRGHRKDDER